jgi:transposase InsO family protein
MSELPLYLIWSNEHQAWWGPGRCGYVRSMLAAGKYTRAEAIDICKRAIPGTAISLGMLPELPVRALDMAAVIIDQPHTPAQLV